MLIVNESKEQCKISTFIVDVIFPANEIHIIGGPSGAGKTSWLLPRIYEWSQGQDVLGHTSHPALYCYVACDRSALSIERTFDGLGLKGKIHPTVSILRPISLPDLLSLPDVPKDTRVLFLEGLARFVVGRGANDYGTVSGFLASVTEMCKSRGVTIFATMHTTKARERDRIYSPRERLLGSVAWAGFSETIIFIEPMDLADVTDARRRVTVLPRNAPTEEFEYHFEENGRFVLASDSSADFLLGNYLDKTEPGAEVSRAQVLKWAKITGVPERTAEDWIKNCVNDDKLLRVGRGAYQKPAINGDQSSSGTDRTPIPGTHS